MADGIHVAMSSSPSQLLAQSSLLLSRSRPAAALQAAESALEAIDSSPGSSIGKTEDAPGQASLRPQALLAKGVALSAAESPAAAVPILEAAVAADPSSMAAAAALGSALAASAPLRVPTALDLLRNAAAADVPGAKASLAALLTDIGVRLARASLPAAAFEHYEQAVGIAPDYAQAWYNLGVCAADTGDSQRAANCYLRCVQINPHHTQAWTNIGVLRKASGSISLAVQAYERALAIDPNYTLAKRNLAIALCELATTNKGVVSAKDTIKVYKRAISLQPTFADAHYCLGVAYCEMGKNERALTEYQLAAQFNPRLIEAHHNLGVVYKLLGNFDASVAAYKAVLAVDANHHQTHSNIAVVYTLLGDVEKAADHLRVAMSIAPNYAESHNNAGVLARDQGDIEQAILHYERCVALDESSMMAAQNRLHALNYTDAWSPNRVFEEHVKWGESFKARMKKQIVEAVNSSTGSATNPELAKYMSTMKRPRALGAIPRGAATEQNGARAGNASSARPLRVGYVSPDFFTHSVSYFVEVLLAKHSSDKITVYTYANVARPDAKTARLSQYPNVKERWRNIWGASAVAVANMILDDEIDILVDCTGHTAANRLDVFALSPAPVQVTWIGYPNSTGLDTIHYRVTDPRADPVDTTQRFVEKLWRLPESFLCYTPSADAPEVCAIPPCMNSGGIVTFGSFNVLAKTQQRTINLWAAILKRLPGSRLLLKSKALGAPSGRRRIEGLFEAAGVSADRLDLVALIPSTVMHLQHYSHIDIALDPFPYAGTTTTCEAVYMGVPVVTLGVGAQHGDHANNVGVSLLTSIGHQDLIAYSEQDYLDIAVRLASNPNQLADMRRKLRSQMMASALGDAARYVANAEAMLFGMWKEQGGAVAPGVPTATRVPCANERTTAAAVAAAHDAPSSKKHRVSPRQIKHSPGGQDHVPQFDIAGADDGGRTRVHLSCAAAVDGDAGAHADGERSPPAHAKDSPFVGNTVVATNSSRPLQ